MSNPYEPPKSSDGNQFIEGTFSTKDSVDVTAEAVADFFEQQGYQLESGDITDGHYGRGNTLLYLFFGAFVKRFRFKVTVEKGATGSEVTVEKGMIGAMGGAIGYMRVNSELSRIRSELANALG